MSWRADVAAAEISPARLPPVVEYEETLFAEA